VRTGENRENRQSRDCCPLYLSTLVAPEIPIKRPLLVIPLILTVFIGLLAWRVRMQDARSHAASGGSATVEGIETVVSSRIGGRITEVLVDQGKRVKKGQPVARIDCADSEATLALATARVHVAEAQVGELAAQIGGAKDSVAGSRAHAAAGEAQTRVLAVAQAQAALDHSMSFGPLAQYGPPGGGERA